MRSAAPGAVFGATAEFPTGSIVGVRIRDGAGADVLPRTTNGVLEDGPGSGIFRKSDLVAPLVAGDYTLAWDDGLSFVTEDLLVTAADTSTVAPAYKPLRGLAFPFRIDPRSGGVAATEGPDKLTENLERLLLTRIGERLMLRDYGGGVTQLLQENINDGLIAVAQQQIGQAILRFEPRVLPQDVSVIPNGAELYLRIQYVQAEVPGLQTTAIRIA